MQQSSGSIGSLAAALARAQVELINPEKSMVATIRPEGRRCGRADLPVCPLVGLASHIIRKTLGQHEIATVQSTSVDQTAGLIRLKTVLAHSSGEWISSDWPVCPLDDMASPKRMGAALTYARRYALFALVGIAGEDDLDAPDLHVAEPVDARGAHAVSHRRPRPNGGDGQLGQKPSAKPGSAPSPAPPADFRAEKKTFSGRCATNFCATWEISTPQKVPPFGRAAFFRPKTLCTKKMHSKWKKPLRTVSKRPGSCPAGGPVYRP